MFICVDDMDTVWVQQPATDSQVRKTQKKKTKYKFIEMKLMKDNVQKTRHEASMSIIIFNCL